MGRKMGDHPRQQSRLDGQVLGDSFDDPIALGEFGQVVLKVAGSNERGQ